MYIYIYLYNSYRFDRQFVGIFFFIKKNLLSSESIIYLEYNRKRERNTFVT